LVLQLSSVRVATCCPAPVAVRATDPRVAPPFQPATAHRVDEATVSSECPILQGDPCPTGYPCLKCDPWPAGCANCRLPSRGSCRASSEASSDLPVDLIRCWTLHTRQRGC